MYNNNNNNNNNKYSTKLFFFYSSLFILITLFLNIIQGNSIENNNNIGILPIHLNPDNKENNKNEEVHLEDFFWTGSGDGPPDYLKNIHTGITKGKDIIVKTETIVVYVDGNNDIDDTTLLCSDCENIGIPLNYSTTDRHFWLLTVLSGFVQPKDYNSLKDKLAKLYRIAFTRQQSLHLGLQKESLQNIKANFTHNRYKRHKINEANASQIDKNIEAKVAPPNENSLRKTESLSKSSEYINTILQSTFSKSNIINETKNDYIKKSLNAQYIHDYNDNNEDTIYGKKQVLILLHNVTLLTQDDIQNWDENLYEQDINDKRYSRPFANQTEIIYSVFVNGKPILATTAAADMKLVSEEEVMSTIGKPVFMKAEPYLKEPQATPLIPFMSSGQPNFFAYIQNNSILIGIISIAFMLLLLLLLALLLMTRAKKQRSADLKRISVRNELLTDNQPTHLDFDSTRTDATALSRVDFTDSNRGIFNYAFEHENAHQSKPKKLNISFPLPPADCPHSSSTESTSDSSVYCPVNRPNVDLQHMLDEKAAKLFDKKKKSKLEQNEPIYTAVVSGSGGAKKRDKKLKQRRHYLTENRVGSIEDNSSADTSLSNESMYGDQNKQSYNRSDSFHKNYHRNKVLNNNVFNDKIYDSVHEDVATTPTEAINREIIKALHGEKSSETGSIGSFLSMGSVKSFPKNILPEPLNRVLDPVAVTYYDHLENITNPQQVKSRKTIAIVERSPKNHQKHLLLASQSDNPDPGVLGPIVWEIHKKKIKKGSEDSPIHDPAASRNRYEGLLEDVVQLYDDLPPIPRIAGKNQKNYNKENRGKSAVISSAPNRAHIDNRPVTASLDKFTPSNNSTQPPSPNRAWSSGQQSPLVRPLSAGPFHRPGPPSVDITRILASQSSDRAPISAAPLIEAIQNELQKFRRENSQ